MSVSLRRPSMFRARKRNAPRPAAKSAPQFLQWLRGRECAARSENCSGRLEAAHTYGAGDKGVGTKSNDSYAIPLCSYHHSLQHREGWKTFERIHFGKAEGIAARLAESYWRAWPGRIAFEKKLADAQN